MSDLEKFISELTSNNSIRKAEGEKYSVYDFLRQEGSKNPTVTLQRLYEKYPEYTPVESLTNPDNGKTNNLLEIETESLTNPDNFKIRIVRLPRSNGKLYPTPVATVTVLWELGSLLPTIRGGKYREVGADSAVKRGTNDPSLTREMLDRHDDKTAGEAIKHRVKTMEDLDVLEDVQAVTQDRIAEVQDILVEAGFRKLSVRRKLGKIYQLIKTKHRHLIDSDRGMVYLKDFLQFADDDLVKDLETLLEYPNQLMVKVTPSEMISVTTESTDQFMSRRWKEEGRILRHDELGQLPDPTFNFSIFLGA